MLEQQESPYFYYPYFASRRDPHDKGEVLKNFPGTLNYCVNICRNTTGIQLPLRFVSFVEMSHVCSANHFCLLK